MPGVSAPNNTEPKGPKHLNMIEMAAPSIYIIPVISLLALAYLNIYDYYIGGEFLGFSGEDSARFGGL